MEYKIAVMKGDGIGPEIINQALKVLNKIEIKYDHIFKIHEVLMGGIAIDNYGVPLPDKTLEVCRQCDAILLGAVGGPKWENLPGNKRPEAGLLKLRSEMGLFANMRPAKIYSELTKASPLKEEIVHGGVDVLVVRELTGGIYFGKRGIEENKAYDTMYYESSEIERVAKRAFEAALKRNKKVTSVDKSNVLDSSRLWRKIVTKVHEDYKEVELEHMYIDNAAMQLIRNPRQFDVLLTSNLFGDILSDESSMITGSIGMLPSASLGEGNYGFYEPIHGSAPDIAGKNIANPIGTILSVAMMLKYSFGLKEESDDIERAVKEVLKEGYRTADIADDNESLKNIGTMKMGELICKKI